MSSWAPRTSRVLPAATTPTTADVPSAAVQEETAIGSEGEADGDHAGVWGWAACCSRCTAAEWQEASLRFGDPGAEKLSAELEQRACSEAEALLAADGSVCQERLALLKHAARPEYVSRVLSRVPFAALLDMQSEQWDAEAMNTSLLLEDFREIRQWQESSSEVRSVFPVRLHSIFEDEGLSRWQMGSAEEKIDFFSRLLPPEFHAAHPQLPPKRAVQRLGGKYWPSLEEFRSLLRSFSSGILEGLPFHPDALLLGGSLMPWCFRRLNSNVRNYCQKEAEAMRFEAKLQQTLATCVGGACAMRILWMAASGDKAVLQQSDIAVSASAWRHVIRQELHLDAWDGADVDLFVVAPSAESTVRATVATLQRNIGAATGGRRAVVLRTRNTLTIVGGHPLPNVQVVTKTVRSSQELLVHADVDCTAMAYDGTRVWAAPRALRALGSGLNFIPKQLLTGFGPRVGRSLVRFSKYFHRGFGLLVFEHCRHWPRCDTSVPPGRLERIPKLVGLEEPRDLRGSPKQKGQHLAKWMRARNPNLRRKAGLTDPSAEAGDVEGGAVKDDMVDIRAHRIVPGDRLSSGGDKASEGKGKGKGETGRDGPFRNYGAQFMDLLIPCGPKVCTETLREYVKELGCPDLLEEVNGDAIFIAPKKNSDRQQWQDRLRGKCYMCKVAVGKHQPWPMCGECAAFNAQKREETADCHGMVAVVTGGRVKIGRHCALRLLRAGASVVLTTRFPRVAVERFREEEDYAAFEDRLLILGADFRRLPSIQKVVDVVLERFDHIDILIHNAAQTVRRPPAYYESLIKKEKELAQLVDGGVDAVEPAACECSIIDEALALLPTSVGLPTMAIDVQAEVMKEQWFPPGQTDAHGDQLDLRAVTSWTMKIEETEMPELAEVLAVNLVVPYLLTARWLPLLRKSKSAFVVFVTSQEGSFSTPTGTKNGTHPHTNVAKAGLNMLAKTVAGDFKREAVFVTAVDPGWVSWMKPGSSGRAAEAAPLSEEDGAARVVDPIFSGLRALHAGRCPPTGVLFKDFRVAPW